jgi:LmbE family N-acetylglucosaminyl deacetylase
MTSRGIKLFLLLFITLLPTTRAVVTPAAEVAEDRGAAGLSQALKRLDVVAGVLHTGAHPDDENSALLAWLSRGQGARTAYLSLTRGEGGVNLVGTELFEALGVIRTEELLAARRLDGAQQFFTPSYEFGFSKTAEDGFGKWGHDQVLGDVVRVIRQFRPEIIISRFTGTPRDGHGHHQIAGIVTQEAFKAAADPKMFPEYGKPWQAKKLYLNAMMPPNANGNANNNANNNDPMGLEINVGEFDPALGRSYNEIAAEGRSMHRSQAQGGPQEKGPRTTRVQLVQKTVDVFDTAQLFAGVIYKLRDLGQLDDTIASDAADLEQKVDAIRQKVNLVKPAGIAPDLAAALKQIQRMRARSKNEQVQFLLEKKEQDFQEALRLATGLVIDVIASDETVVPGQEFDFTVSVINGGPFDFPNIRVKTDLPAGWDATLQGSTGSAMSGQRLDQKYKVKVGANPDFTQPYWLRAPRRGDRFVWPAATPDGKLPEDQTLLPTRVELDYEGTAIATEKTAQYRRIDRMLGEQRTALKTVPAISVTVGPNIAIVPLKGKREKEFTVTVENQNPTRLNGNVTLQLPQGWTSAPAARPFSLTQQGEKESLSFVVTVPASPGDFVVQAIARVGNQEIRNGYTLIAYPHIESRYVYSPAESKVEVMDLVTTIESVGYVEGTGDAIPDALRQLGIDVTVLSPKDVATSDLSRFRAIILGVRAYAVRDDLRAYNKRLLEYVSNGGNLVVQYNRGNEIGNLQIGPYPFTAPNVNDNNRDRVTKEDAPVKLLNPDHPLLSIPNKITEADFDGWVDERGTFFLQKWDPKYTALLESHDTGEAPREGGLVVAKYGKGSYIYAGYSFFRQLPAGVKGAYRLFANLVSAEN